MADESDLNTTDFSNSLLNPGSYGADGIEVHNLLFLNSKLPTLNSFSNSTEKEKERINERLGVFDPKQTWQKICDQFGPNIKHPELVSIASVVAGVLGIKLDRDAKRRKKVLIKWFEENWTIIAPILPKIQLQEPNSNTNM